jgi:nitrous oxidase accessory protein
MIIVKIAKRFVLLGLIFGFIGTINVSSINTFETTISPVTWYVDDDGNADFTRIQDAINASNNGDTIYVYRGSYNELLTVDKSLTLIGERKDMTIINGERNGTPVSILASNVSIRGFNVFNSILDGYHAGINVYGEHVQIIDCFVQESDCGFRLTFTNDILLENCIIRYCDYHSIYVLSSSNVTIRNCEIYDNGDEEGSFSGGIEVSPTIEGLRKSNICIQSCDIHDNALDGITVGDGFIKEGFTNVTIENNKIYDNSDTGIAIIKTDATIRNNSIFRNGVQSGVSYDGGVLLQDSDGPNIIENNMISSNYRKGVCLLRSYNTTIQHNTFINNTVHASFTYRQLPASNKWEGNYWDNQRLSGMKIIFGVYEQVLQRGFTNNLRFFIISYLIFNIDRNTSAEPN